MRTDQDEERKFWKLVLIVAIAVLSVYFLSGDVMGAFLAGEAVVIVLFICMALNEAVKSVRERFRARASVGVREDGKTAEKKE